MKTQLDGRSEESIGLKGLAKEFLITTKAPTATPGKGTYDNIIEEARLSFAALKVDRVRDAAIHLNPRKCCVIVWTALTEDSLLGPSLSPPCSR